MDDLEPFESPKLLFKGAEKSIPSFEQACDSFVKGCRYDVVRHIDPNTRDEVFKLRFRDRIPGELRLAASHILNDLRHALDQAVSDAAVLLGRRDAKGVYFPIGATPKCLSENILSPRNRL